MRCVTRTATRRTGATRRSLPAVAAMPRARLRSTISSTAASARKRSEATVVARRPGLSITELQEQIFQREGFRVSFERLGSAKGDLPPYEFPVMAPNGWTVSDWRRLRLGAYVLLFRGVTVYRGDDEPLARDMKLAHLRDSYYRARYG